MKLSNIIKAGFRNYKANMQAARAELKLIQTQAPLGAWLIKLTWLNYGVLTTASALFILILATQGAT